MNLELANRLTEEIANAIQRHEDEYATYELRRAIKLPKPQTAGTMTQQRSYAVDKAREIIENL